MKEREREKEREAWKRLRIAGMNFLVYHTEKEKEVGQKERKEKGKES